MIKLVGWLHLAANQRDSSISETKIKNKKKSLINGLKDTLYSYIYITLYIQSLNEMPEKILLQILYFLFLFIRI